MRVVLHHLFSKALKSLFVLQIVLTIYFRHLKNVTGKLDGLAFVTTILAAQYLRLLLSSVTISLKQFLRVTIPLTHIYDSLWFDQIIQVIVN